MLNSCYLLPATRYPRMSRKAQSEMIGFALILVIVTILIFVFMSISQDKSEEGDIKDYEPNSFLQSMLFHTTDCQVGSGVEMYANIEKLMKYCVENRECINDIKPCVELKEELDLILKNSWSVGSELRDKGYSLNLTYMGEEVYGVSEGIVTQNSRYAFQPFDGDRFIEFVLYR